MALSDNKDVQALIPEDLSRKGLTEKEVVLIWSQRRGRMATRRKQFETLWRNGITRFFEGIVTGEGIGANRLYNTLYEQYDFSVFSRDGMRFNNLKYPLLPAIVMRAIANELPNKPKPHFTAQGVNDPTKAKAFEAAFQQVLYEMSADEEDFEIFLDKRVFGSAAVLVQPEEMTLTVKDPKYNVEKDELEYEEITKKTKQVRYRKIDLRNLYLDEHCTKTNLKDCGYFQFDEYYSKEEFLVIFKDLDPEKQARILSTPFSVGDGTEFYNWFDKKGIEHIRVTYCYDKYADCYHIIANDCELVNKVDQPIPRIAGKRGKELPLALAIQYKIPGAPYGYGDSHVTSSFNQIKNLIRVMILEITQKSAKPMLAIDPMSNFDEQGFEWGTDFVRVEPDKLKEIGINPNLRPLYDMDSMVDSDIIRVTGININDTTNVDAGETARKSIIRRESQNAIIELGMNYMSNSFFYRLYNLLKDDVKLYYAEKLAKQEDVNIKTKGAQLVRNNGGFDEEAVQGYRYFKLQPEDLDFDAELDLEMGNIATSKELTKALAKEGFDAAMPLMQSGAIDPKGLARWLKESYDMPDYVMPGANNPMQGKDPEAIATEGIPPELLPPGVNAKMAAQAGAMPGAAPQGAPAPEAAPEGQPMPPGMPM